VAEFRVCYFNGGSEVIQAADYLERDGFHEFYVWMGDKPMLTTRIESQGIAEVEAIATN